ncbi:MAG: alpha-1,2-fucosyltransferase [Planctomycetes bacterium]|nr:alpha-1,2-fucosyltransferase [Planctomycetota bacterium]MBU1517382.1 alpha-1,2-fucosyltransferase [Planctomycetota bacterium]MBU2596809.1 alpha-1,2-fucosyltransferase [Planctomycetota bacterium]
MSKVIVRIKGGFGNQLFCYAAARRLGLVNNSELVIDDVTGFVRDHQYRRQYVLDRFHISARKATAIERMEPFERYRRGLAKFVSRRKPFLKRRYVEQEGIEFDARLLDIKVEKTIYLDGLWQSENYFRDVSQTIRRDLRTIPPKDTINQNMAEKIRKCTSIAVHIRWFDKSDNGSVGYNLKCSYYARATKEIMGRVTMPHFFIFSNNPEATRQMLDLPEDIVTYVDHNRGDDNAYADFWLMTQCKHFIIANSTFSWWGAWLAESKSKIIIAPSLKLIGVNSWGFDGLIPDGWVLL